MARAQAVVDLRAISKTASQPIIDALHARIEPGGVLINDDDSVANGLRWVVTTLATLFVAIGYVGVATSAGDPKRMDGAIGMGFMLWIAIWAALGPSRLFWRKRNLPWKPGVYGIGPHVVDARTAKLRFFAIQSVAAELDGDRGAHRPCIVRVTSSWKTHAIRIKDRDVAVRVRDQLSAQKGDTLAPLVATSAAARPGDPGGARREPIALRLAFLSSALIAGAIAVPLTLILW